MTQQTLREEFHKKFGFKSPEGCAIADFFLAHFKEFAEEEMIGKDEVEKVAGFGVLLSEEEIHEIRIRNKFCASQRAKLQEYLK